MTTKTVTEEYRTVTPYLIVEGVDKLIDFLTKAFDAKETMRESRPDGTIRHAQVKIGDSVVMMGESPDDWKPMPGSIYLYVKDTDTTYKRALQAGATSVMEPMDQDYGHRSSGVEDPCGNYWWISSPL